MVAKGLAFVHVRDMHLKNRPLKSVERVENGHRSMGISSRVNDDPCGFLARFVDPVDELPLDVGLQQNTVEPEAARDLEAARLNIAQRVITVDFRLSLTQKVQVRPIEDIDFARRGRAHGSGLSLCRCAVRQVRAGGAILRRARANLQAPHGDNGPPHAALASQCGRCNTFERLHARESHGRKARRGRENPFACGALQHADETMSVAARGLFTKPWLINALRVIFPPHSAGKYGASIC